MYLGCPSFLFIDWQVMAARVQTVVVYRWGRLVHGHDSQCQLVLHMSVYYTQLLDLTKTVQVVYIDGSHLPQDVLTDATMAWKLLKNGGIIIFDGWCMTATTHIQNMPTPARSAACMQTTSGIMLSIHR